MPLIPAQGGGDRRDTAGRREECRLGRDRSQDSLRRQSEDRIAPFV